MRQWVRRLAGLAGLEAAVLLVARIAGFEPNLPAVLATVAALTAASWLLADAAVVGDDVPWQPEPAVPYFLPGRDPKLAAYSRLIEDHLSAGEPSDALRHRLRAIAAERLERSPGAVLPPRTREVLAAEGRLSLANLSAVLDDIEGLP